MGPPPVSGGRPSAARHLSPLHPSYTCQLLCLFLSLFLSFLVDFYVLFSLFFFLISPYTRASLSLSLFLLNFVLDLSYTFFLFSKTICFLFLFSTLELNLEIPLISFQPVTRKHVYFPRSFNPRERLQKCPFCRAVGVWWKFQRPTRPFYSLKVKWVKKGPKGHTNWTERLFSHDSLS